MTTDLIMRVNVRTTTILLHVVSVLLVYNKDI